MNVLLCSSNVLPCPVADQQLMSLAQLVAEAVLQIDPASFAMAYAFGAASVCTWWGLGYVIAAAQKVLGKA